MKVLTDQFLKNVPAPEAGKRPEYRDQGHTGLALRLTSDGVKTWNYLYSFAGKKCRLTIGTYPEISLSAARKAAATHRQTVEEGKNPIVEQRSNHEKQTFGDVAALWFEDRRKAGKRSLDNDEWNYGKWVEPEWKNRAIDEIRRKDVKALLRKVSTPTGVTRNRVLSLVKTIFNFALDDEIIESNPAARMKPPVEEIPRVDQVKFSEEQVRKIWDAVCAFENERLHDFYQLAFLTAAREGEILGMTWGELSLSNPAKAEWTLTGERVKNGKAWSVPLPPAAVELLRGRKERAGENATPDALVLNGLKKRSLNDHHHKFVEKVGIPFNVHDARSMIVSRMAEWEIPDAVLDRILNHEPRSITDRKYKRYAYLDERRVALARWQSWLNEEEMPSNVVPLRPMGAA